MLVGNAGGTVDYGEAHSSRFGHARFGRTYEGTHPGWSAQSPIHIVGHSLGGSTVRVLQHLLHICAFPGHNTSADWICSLTAINAPLNGSLAAYALGLQEASAPDVVRFSPGSLLGSIVHLIAFLDIKPFGFDVGLQHWNLSFRGESHRDVAGRARCWRQAARSAWRAGRTLVMSLLVKSIVVQSEDNAAFDASVHAMASYNRQMGVAHDCTFYLSLVGDATDAHTTPPRADWAGGRQWYNQLAAPLALGWILATLQWVLRRVLLTVISWLTARRSYQAVASSLSHVDGLDLAAFRASASDGLCCTFSQSHPRVGVSATEAEQRVMAMPAAASAMRRGVWHVQRHSQDHMGIVPFPVSPIQQRQTFAALFGRLRSLPAAACPGAHKLDRPWQALPASAGLPRARLSPYISCEAEPAEISDTSALSDAEPHGSTSLQGLQEKALPITRRRSVIRNGDLVGVSRLCDSEDFIMGLDLYALVEHWTPVSRTH